MFQIWMLFRNKAYLMKYIVCIRVSWIYWSVCKYIIKEESDSYPDRIGVERTVSDCKSEWKLPGSGVVFAWILYWKTRVLDCHYSSDVQCCKEINEGEENARGSVEEE